MSSATETPKTKSQGALFALGRIVVAAALLAGVYVLYGKHVETSKTVKDRARQAHDLTNRDGVKEYRDAIRLLDEALALQKNDPYAVATLGELSARLWIDHGFADEAEAARRYTKRAVDASINFAERFGAEGLVMLGEGNIDEAQAEMQKLAEDGVGDARILGVLGLAHARQGKLVAAKADLKQAADREWRSPRYNNLYGEIAFDGGDYPTAAGAHAKALELIAGHARAIIGKARADVARGQRVAESIEALDAILARSSDEISPVLRERALTGKAEALLASGEFEKAEEAAREAIAVNAKVDPGIAHAHFTLGLALARQEKSGALDAFKQALALYKGVDRFSFDSALALAVAGRAEEGMGLLEAYASSHDVGFAYHLATGDFHVATAEYAKAHEAFDKAIELNPVSPDGYYKKGALLALEGRQPKANRKQFFDEALKQFEKTVQIREKYADVYRQVGLIYLDLNPRSGEALQQFAKALLYFKEQKAPKATFDAFIDEVEQRYITARLPANAKAWREEAEAMAR